MPEIVPISEITSVEMVSYSVRVRDIANSFELNTVTEKTAPLRYDQCVAALKLISDYNIGDNKVKSELKHRMLKLGLHPTLSTYYDIVEIEEQVSSKKTTIVEII